MATNQKQTSISKPSVTFETIKFIFGKLWVRYGSKQSSQYSDKMLPVVQQEWLDELKGMSPQDINRGLSTWEEDWPPNIMEFKKACTKPNRPVCYRDENDFDKHPRLLPAPTNKEVGRKEMKKMRELGII